MADEGEEDSAVAANLRKLMKRQRIGGIGALRSAMALRGIAIGSGAIQRALKGGGRNRLDTLNKMAAFFDVTTDQLLQPDLGVDDVQWVGDAAPAVTEKDRRLLEDFRVLMEHDQARFAREIAELAGQMRAHEAKVLARNGVKLAKAPASQSDLEPQERYGPQDERDHVQPLVIDQPGSAGKARRSA